VNRGTDEQGNRGTDEQVNTGTDEQRNRGTVEQRNRGTEEQKDGGTDYRGIEEAGRVNLNLEPDDYYILQLIIWNVFPLLVIILFISWISCFVLIGIIFLCSFNRLIEYGYQLIVFVNYPNKFIIR